MDEVRSYVRLDLPAVFLARPRERLFHFILEFPCWKGLRADSEEKREPVSGINAGVVDSLKVLDPQRPIREADIGSTSPDVRK